MDKIGERLKKCRLEAGLTQQEVANKLGLTSRSIVCDYEKSRHSSMNIPNLQRFADLYGVTTAYLLGWEIGDEEKKENYYSQLPKDEQILLEAYRQGDGTYRKMMEMIIFNYIEERNKKNAESEEN